MKDGGGSLSMILGADQGTAATIGQIGCGIPEVEGAYESDIDFGAGSWIWDPDLEAHFPVGYDPGSDTWYTQFMNCGHCVTELLGGPPGGPDKPTPLPPGTGPPFATPLPEKYPVMLDAGDIGFSEIWLGHHADGVDWVSDVGTEARAVATTKTPWCKHEPVKEREKIEPHYELDQDYLPFAPPLVAASWRQTLNASPGMTTLGVNEVSYRHHTAPVKSLMPTPTVDATYTPMGTTIRLKNDNNLGPHIHFNMKHKDSTGTLHETQWKERYFPPQPEIPLAVYLMVTCRYGWTQNGFFDYAWDWGESLLGVGTEVCMAFTGSWDPDPLIPPTKTIRLGFALWSVFRRSHPR